MRRVSGYRFAWVAAAAVSFTNGLEGGLLGGAPSACADTVTGTGGVIPASGTGGGGLWGAGSAATSLPTAPSSFSVSVPNVINGVNSITFTNFQHTYLGDVHAVLVSPDGASYNIFVRPGLFSNGPADDGHQSNFNGNYVFVQSGAPNNLPTTTTGQNTNFNQPSGTYNQTFGGSPAAGATWVSGNFNIFNVPMGSIRGPAGAWKLRVYDWAPNDVGSLASWTLNYNVATPAPALVPMFIGGAILINGSADGPNDPSTSANAPGTVSALAATGSGSTSSGLVGGNANLNSLITLSSVTHTLHIQGSAVSTQPPNYGGFAFIGISCAEPDFTPAPLVLNVPRLMTFSTVNNNVSATTTFTAVTGQVVGNKLLPGTYTIDLFCGATVQDPQTSVTATLDWTLSMTPVVQRCPGETNIDGIINVNDLLAVIANWGPCAQPAFCVPDFNYSGSVDVNDLLTVVTHWGACP